MEGRKQTLDEWWANAVGASKEWTENYANAYLPFGALCERNGHARVTIPESAFLWTHSRWNLLLLETPEGTYDGFYANFSACCRKMAREWRGSAQ